MLGLKLELQVAVECGGDGGGQVVEGLWRGRGNLYACSVRGSDCR